MRLGLQNGRTGPRRGSAVLEMALVLPVLLALAFGTVEFGYFFFVKHSVQSAAREGARAAIVPGATSANVSTAVTSSLTASGLNNISYTTSITDANNVPINPTTVAAGTSVKVTVSMRWGDAGVRPLGVISANKAVRGATVMRKEG